VRDVVAADLHVAHDRWLAFVITQRRSTDRLAVGPDAPQHVGPHVDVDVAVVVVERLQLARRVLPLLVVEVHGAVLAAETQDAAALLPGEGIERLQLFVEKRRLPTISNVPMR